MAIQFPANPTATPENGIVVNGDVTYEWDDALGAWAVTSGGGGSSNIDLQGVTDNGNTTTNKINTAGYRIDELDKIEDL